MLCLIKGDDKEEALFERENFSGFVLIGAGLPRTGTSSTRLALAQLLEGKIYHMNSVGQGDEVDWDFWDHLFQGKKHRSEDWVRFLEGQGYRGGLDNPIAIYFKELMEAFPNAKVLLTVRDPESWYHSVKDSIYVNNVLSTTWPFSFFFMFLRKNRVLNLIRRSSYTPMVNNMGMYHAIEKGREASVDFFNAWVAKVKSEVPQDRLLVFDVRQGWEPLCKFLEMDIPDNEFPRTNDTVGIKQFNRRMLWTGRIVNAAIVAAIAFGLNKHFKWF